MCRRLCVIIIIVGVCVQNAVCHSEGPGEMKRREVVLELVVSPEEIMSREVELGCERWPFFFFFLLLASSCYSTAAQRTLSL